MNKEIFSIKDWNELSSNYSVNDICSSLTFREAMLIVEHLFYDDIQDDEK